MTAWIEAIAARVGMEAHMRDGTVEKFATITEAERDRLVALARGVESFVVDCQKSSTMLRMLGEEDGALAYALVAETLRRLLDGETP